MSSLLDFVDLSRILEIVKIKELKREQKLILDTITKSENCVAILPTGYGKSLPYQLFLLVMRELDGEAFENKKIIVCSPLKSLMEDQVQNIKEKGILTAEYLGSSDECDIFIKEGQVDIIFGCPETLVGDRKKRELIEKLDVSLIVVDEFHTIATWGGMGQEGDAFRKWFRYIGELRSMFPESCLLALSATCTKEMEKTVVKVLGIDVSRTIFIRVSPNRENIKFSVIKVSTNVEEVV